MDRRERLGIGEFAAVTGLTPRALRLYADAKALVPVDVDPSTGYRTYDRSQVERAELIRLLRAGGVPVPDLQRVLDNPSEEAVVMLDAHIVTIDDVHERARSAVHLARTRIAHTPTGALVTSTLISRAALTAAFDAVSRCCAADPEPIPGLTGVRVRIDADGLHLASSDRYSAAFIDLPCSWDSAAEAERLVPPGFLTGAVARWPEEVEVQLRTEGLVVAGELVPTIDATFPDVDAFRPFLAGLELGCVVTTADLLAALAETDGPTDDEPVAVLRVDLDAQELVVSVRGRDVTTDDSRPSGRVAATVAAPMETSWVSPSRLRGILAALGDSTVLSLTSTSPVAIATHGDASHRFLLMPMASAEIEEALATARPLGPSVRLAPP